MERGSKGHGFRPRRVANVFDREGTSLLVPQTVELDRGFSG